MLDHMAPYYVSITELSLAEREAGLTKLRSFNGLNLNFGTKRIHSKDLNTTSPAWPKKAVIYYEYRMMPKTISTSARRQHN